MWGHFVNLLGTVWARVLSALGTTTLSIILFSLAAPVIAFVGTMAYLWRSEGGFLVHVKRSAIPTLIGLLVPLGLIALVFTWNAVRNVYDDHTNIVARWQSALKDKSDLKSKLEQEDDRIRQLESRSFPTTSNTGGSRSTEPKRIWTRYYDLQQATVNGKRGAVILVEGLTNHSISPVDVVLTCNSDVALLGEGGLGLGTAAYLNSDYVTLDGRSIHIKIGSPAWTAETPLGVPVFRQPSDLGLVCHFKTKDGIVSSDD